MTHRFGSEADLRGFKQRARGWLASVHGAVIEVPATLRPFARAMLDIIKAEVRRQEAVGEAE